MVKEGKLKQFKPTPKRPGHVRITRGTVRVKLQRFDKGTYATGDKTITFSVMNATVDEVAKTIRAALFSED